MSLLRRKVGRAEASLLFCFNTERKAAKAVELIDGRSWNGRKLQANVARYSSKGEMDRETDQHRLSSAGGSKTYLEALLGSGRQTQASS